ncbi:transposase [Nitrosomonas sp. Nm58]|uniref:transposase n=1 Tax=Nitrosomonas sp. Nm58 TaxID=200126 RepID=UPI00089D2DCE|nr:Transposase, Mutator family [Nitrosomonas sp. Nm58]
MTVLAAELVVKYTDINFQLCIVYLIRYSLSFVSWKLRKTVAADLRAIYLTATMRDAEKRLMKF